MSGDTILTVEKELVNHVLEQLDYFKDVGMRHRPDNKHHVYVDAAFAKVGSAGYLIRSAFTYLTPEVFLRV